MAKSQDPQRKTLQEDASGRSLQALQEDEAVASAAPGAPSSGSRAENPAAAPAEAPLTNLPTNCKRPPSFAAENVGFAAPEQFHLRFAEVCPGWKPGGLLARWAPRVGRSTTTTTTTRTALEDAHEVCCPQLNLDWTLTLAGSDWDTELWRRAQRNIAIKSQLQSGRRACYRSSGNSLRLCGVISGQMCTYAAVDANCEPPIAVGNIVFCEVQPGYRFYAHMVKSINMGQDGTMCYTISDGEGWENGWTTMDYIYGRLISVHD